ncbi:hypothetical protein QBC46DRAFT_32966 [Diplogelasinospora grovesii]|uniref:Prp 4 CRoW domain-containing protein n=1 Tax=Diplogelasinospora grovesii TaxID=303347 RepID=A0AAN6N0W2_9PEZI|nr:hypothetical protein QBC46DRAFT_32966 [Diplogelasinospora grovesii]
MLAKSISLLAVFAFAATAAAEPVPYKPQQLHKMSVREMFGVVRRQGSSGYQPTQSVCGTGNTCEEACGAGYTTCASQDSQIHCYNAAAAQTCCPDNTGNSCDAGYYCTADKQGGTWCCPDGMDVVACAAAYSVTGGLVSETPKPTTSSTSSSSSSTTSAAPLTTSTSNTTTAAATTFSSVSSAKNSTVTDVETDTITTCTATLAPSASYPKSNSTTISYVATGTPSPSAVVTSAGSLVAPAGALLLLAAGFAALL